MKIKYTGTVSKKTRKIRLALLYTYGRYKTLISTSLVVKKYYRFVYSLRTD